MGFNSAFKGLNFMGVGCVICSVLWNLWTILYKSHAIRTTNIPLIYTHTHTNTHKYMCLCVYIYIYVYIHTYFIFRVPIILFFFCGNKCKPHHISIAGRTKLVLQKPVIFYCGVIKKIRPVRIKKESQEIAPCFGMCFKLLTGRQYVAVQSGRYKIELFLYCPVWYNSPNRAS